MDIPNRKYEPILPDMRERLGIPALTDEQKEALFEREDRGIIPVEGMLRFPTFEDWMDSGGVQGKGNFLSTLATGLHGTVARATQHFQRFELLYPEELERLTQIATMFMEDKRPLSGRIDEDIEIAFHDAYEKLADLVDANDSPLVLTNGRDLPKGQAYSHIIMT